MHNLNDVVETTDRLLSERGFRAPQYEQETNALRALAIEMADRPDDVLGALCDQIIAICGAESSGVSLLDGDAATEFYWPAIAGQWAQYEGGGMPRGASPCGVVLEKDASLIFHDVEIQFPAAAVATPRIGEILLAPFRKDGKPIGTVWAIVHSDAKRFDRGDQRLLESLAQFAGAAFQMTEAVKAAREARTQLSLVNNELAHRLRNMLTMVMAVASQTLKGVSERDAVAAFEARLQALASAHDILVDQTWVAAPIALVAERVLGILCEPGRTALTGPDITLGPRAALSLSLILHELGTNALKYGALSVAGGTLSFSWEVKGETEPTLYAYWIERGGPKTVVPTRRGFGTRLISMGLIGTGGVKLEYTDTGLQAIFEAPLRLAQAQDRAENLNA